MFIWYGADDKHIQGVSGLYKRSVPAFNPDRRAGLHTHLSDLTPPDFDTRFLLQYLKSQTESEITLMTDNPSVTVTTDVVPVCAADFHGCSTLY